MKKLKNEKYHFNYFYEVLIHNSNISPNKNIIIDGNYKINNKLFKAKVDTIAEYLLSIGVTNGDKVALIMSNSWQFIVNCFAISKIGAIPVPINNFLKEDDFAYIIINCKAKVVFSSFKFKNETSNLYKKTNIEKLIWVGGCHIENEINIDYEKIISKKYSNFTANHVSNINDLALILYTSGTTGKPKGAMLSFRGLFSNCIGTLNFMELKGGQLTMISYLPMFHSMSFLATILMPIFSNGCIVVSEIKDFKYVLKQILFKRCKYFIGTPEIYKILAKTKLPWYFHMFHCVKGFISGSSALSEEIYNNFTKAFKKGKLLEEYGITECSPVVSCNSLKNKRVGSVGLPIQDYQVKIFNNEMIELKTGEVGEICVKGDSVMLGYFNDPESTSESIKDGWFRTGDLGKLDEDGYIYIVDRIKDIIIHKGINIYPREIEELLYTNPKINICAVIAEKDANNNETPIAYVVLKENEIATETEIKDFIKPNLANFKMIRRVIFVDDLPKTATGKILKRELRIKHNQINKV